MPAIDEFMTIGVGLDSSQATKGSIKFQKDLKKQLKLITKAVGLMGKANEEVSQEAASDAKNWSDQVKALTKYYKEETDQIDALKKAVKAAEKAREQGDEQAKKAAQDRLKILRDELTKRKKSFAKKVDVGFDTSKMADEAKEGFKDAAKGAKDILSSFFSKDLKGMFSGGGEAVTGLTKGLHKGLAAKSAAMTGRGTALSRAGTARGGLAGAGMKGLGTALKGLGGLGKSLGPMIKALSSIGPILGAVGGAFMAVIKLMFDAQAQAKEFQKNLLQSASTAEYLADAGGNANVAYANLNDTVKGIREAAHDFNFNDTLGISPETHSAVINALNQEGVSIKAIENQAKVAGKTVGEFSQSLIATSVAYSRSFGVSLQEVNSFQAELMTEMGATLGTTQTAFSQISKAATESGIATNKFFAMIRGVSQDLSLYNVRLDSSVKLFKMLNKVMNPREASKFMSSIMGTMKNMSQDDRLKVTLLAGKKGSKILEKDLENRRTNLYSDIGEAIGMQADEVQKKLSDPKASKALWEEVQKKAPEQLGTLKGSSLELNIDTTASKKGDYGRAFAMQNLGLGSTVDMLKAAIPGGGDLTSRAGELGATKFAEMMGISTEQLRGFMKLEAAVKEQKEVLQAEGEQGMKDAAGITDAVKRAEAQAAAQHKLDLAKSEGTQDILDSMSKEEKKGLEDGTKSATDFAKKQTELTQDLGTRLQNLIDFLMNELYNVLLGMWDKLADIAMPLIGDESRDKTKLEIEVARTKDPELMKLLKEAGGDRETFEKLKVNRNLKSTAKGEGDWYNPGESKTEPGKSPLDTKTSPEAKAYPENQSLAEGTSLISESPKALNMSVGAFGVTPEREVETSIDKNIKNLSKEDIASLTNINADQLEGLESLAVDTESGAEAGTITANALTSQATAYVAFSQKFLQGKYKKVLKEVFTGAIEKEGLDAIRTALFEFYLYSDLDKESVVKTLKSGGMSIPDLVSSLSEGAQEGLLPEDVNKTLGEDVPKPEKKQHGGTVSRISREGLAIFKRPSGEGVTGIRPGEQIVPAYAGGAGVGAGGGGGNTSVVISLAPDAQRVIQAEVKHGIYEHERRKSTAG